MGAGLSAYSDKKSLEVAKKKYDAKILSFKDMKKYVLNSWKGEK